MWLYFSKNTIHNFKLNPKESLPNTTSKVPRKEALFSILTAIAFTMAIAQDPLIYYFTSGPAGVIFAIPFLAIGIGLTFFLLGREYALPVASRNKTRQKILIATTVIGLIGMLMGEEAMAELDWQLRKKSRMEIVNLIKAGTISPNVNDRPRVCLLSSEKYPLISNGGNEISIERDEKGKLSVEFFIDRGFLDHYSAFVYSESPERIRELEQTVERSAFSSRKIDRNWYKMSF